MGVAYIFYNTGIRRRTDMKVGFIGGGNMASAMIGGMIQKDIKPKAAVCMGADGCLFLCYTITKTDEFVSSRYIGAGRAVRSGQLARSKSADRCGSPVATSKGRRHFEAPTEPTGETAAL